MKSKKDKLNRIEESSFKVTDVKTTKAEASVMIAQEGTFSLSPFAIKQIIAGAFYPEFLSESVKNFETARLIARITFYAPEDEMVGITLDRKEVGILKGLLEARIRHCEHERDDEDKCFNPDTYISQKLLLLDIREWLSIYSYDMIEVPKENEEAH